MSERVIEIHTDVALIGAGIMSATLGSLLRQLQPNWSIHLFETLDAAAAESSDPWNNAGTGHSALCELNYTPQSADGSVDVSKAIAINEQFQVSRQFWSHALDQGILTKPREFINPTPHVAFVHGEANVEYMRKRYDGLADQPLFKGIEYITDEQTFTDRLPLMAKRRDFSDPVALTWSDKGTDVDFGSLTKKLINYVAQAGSVHFGHEVVNLKKQKDGWLLSVTNRRTGEKTRVYARFVFVGAGGGALPLLQKAGIKEAKGFGGFPISGQFLRCTNPDVIAQHGAKVYGKASVGAPPMSVPHLDTRVINGERGLLFGPFAGFSPKFLKNGSLGDLPLSVKPNNLLPMLQVGMREMALTKYLISELAKNQDGRVDALREFAPTGASSDWRLITAGQRVQVIRNTDKGGSLEFGTAIIAAEADGIAGLLGASPGASTAVTAMLSVLEQCFPKHFDAWKPKLTDMIPSFGRKLNDNPGLTDELWDWTQRSLQLDEQSLAVAEPDAQPASIG